MSNRLPNVSRVSPGCPVADPTVSVVMATRNSAQFVEEALNSVARQGIDGLELVAVDGASSDGTVEVLRSFPFVRVLPQAGAGFAVAWNEGIRLSRGEYVAFLDSDDIYRDGALRAHLAAFKADPALDASIGRVRFFAHDGTLPPGFRPHLLEGDHVGNMPGTLMVKRTSFDRIGEFEESWRITSDIEWFARMRTVGARSVEIPAVVLEKRVHSSNLSYVTSRRLFATELVRIARVNIERQRNDPPRSSS
jgi:glycosyltransferase involved in cell wall biosynthesis